MSSVDVERPATRLSLGPVLYLWDSDKWRDFYFRIADEAPVDYVTLGETVCSKRLHFTEPHLPDVIERLERAGKTVQLASLSLVTLQRELAQTRSLVENGQWPVEANDLSALRLLNGRPHGIGPTMSVYNAATAKLLAGRGASYICLPPELPDEAALQISSAVPGCEIELFAFGRVPLAISARCAHARSKGLVKDSCQFVCGDDPDGLEVRTLARQPFLALNGVQTLSYTCQALTYSAKHLSELRVARLRLSPQECDMVAVTKVFSGLVSGDYSSEEAEEKLRSTYPQVPLSNGFAKSAAGAAWVSRNQAY